MIKIGDKVIESCGCVHKVVKMGRKWLHLDGGKTTMLTFNPKTGKYKKKKLLNFIRKYPVGKLNDFLLYRPTKYKYRYDKDLRRMLMWPKKETK